MGLSIKVGCTVRFALRTQPDTPDIAEVLYYNSEHSAACQVGCCFRPCMLMVWENRPEQS